MALGPLLVGLTFRLTPALLAYLTGLITQENITATVLASQVGVVSHDDLTRLLRSIGPGLSAGACWAVPLATRLGADGWLIIDDVLLPKPFAQALAFAGWDYDHASNRNTYGLRLVFVVWCNGQSVPRRKRAGRKQGHRVLRVTVSEKSQVPTGLYPPRRTKK